MTGDMGMTYDEAAIAARLDRKFAIESARGWRPIKGQPLVGRVLDITHVPAESKDRSNYNMWIIEPTTYLGAPLPDSDCVAIHAFHQVLSDALTAIDAKVGSLIAVRYEGAVEKPNEDGVMETAYHHYTAVDVEKLMEDNA